MSPQKTRNIAEEVRARLASLQPTAVGVVDESHRHAGHRGAIEHASHTGYADGTHLEITIVSPLFAGQSPVARHRMVYALLADLMNTRIHALKIDARCN